MEEIRKDSINTPPAPQLPSQKYLFFKKPVNKPEIYLK